MKKQVSNRKRKLIPGHVDHYVACDKVAEKYGLDPDKLHRSIMALFKQSLDRSMRAFYPVFIKNLGTFKANDKLRNQLRVFINRGRKAAHREENLRQKNKKKLVENNKKKRILAKTNKTTQR